MTLPCAPVKLKPPLKMIPWPCAGTAPSRVRLEIISPPAGGAAVIVNAATLEGPAGENKLTCRAVAGALASIVTWALRDMIWLTPSSDNGLATGESEPTVTPVAGSKRAPVASWRFEPKNVSVELLPAAADVGSIRLMKGVGVVAGAGQRH